MRYCRTHDRNYLAECAECEANRDRPAQAATGFKPGWYIGWKKFHFWDTSFTTLCGRTLLLPVLMATESAFEYPGERKQCGSCQRSRLKELKTVEET
jgi:hypothetical protein